jgi:hypothetical protein
MLNAMGAAREALHQHVYREAAPNIDAQVQRTAARIKPHIETDFAEDAVDPG